MSTDHKLDLLVLVALACLFVGDGFGWTWYVRVAAWAVLLTFFAIAARRCCVDDGKGRPMSSMTDG